MTIEVAVELTIPDNTARTVLAVFHELGYPELVDVQRADLLRMTCAGSIEQLAEALLNAEIIYNPNKHRLSYAADEPSGDVEAIVSDNDDDTRILSQQLAGPFRLPELTALERAVSWRLYEKETPASRERHIWACRKLLANPYSQTFSVRSAPKRVPFESVRERKPAAPKMPAR